MMQILRSMNSAILMSQEFQCMIQRRLRLQQHLEIIMMPSNISVTFLLFPSLEEESFTSGLLEYPHYTRPREWNDCNVPQVLLSGNHREIYAWRKHQAESLTKERRPDLWERYLERDKKKTVK